MNNVIFSSASDEWSTPQNVYDQLNDEFNFNLDPCATHENHKCNRYFTKEQNGLNQWWGGGTIAFVNPPYSEISAWVKKCYYESLNPKSIVVMLIPARTDTKYFHDYILAQLLLLYILFPILSGNHFSSTAPQEQDCLPSSSSR